ncbi:MAG: HAD hydrolase-like protein [Oscillatoriaceae bacterium SKW80]|nr:HAD hydrolase-like protein [Oscillatoriaceae bacterium SKYG93]MCX8120142.1 HAD hydrolase-like protein [Oscillatoriaceae bacterium SKW80]MDW8453068.1 HAD hydrolase-like protein [Oscillatoriaceae cyanobacterium SKYGB_i_bin93]HIK29021.1 HAD family hydrolase [Oscillatoriaceae cyanobacterium M7585_C2015_266]
MVLEQINLLIFDLDGVITSENKYWNTARMTVWELITNEKYLGLKNYFCQEKEPSKILKFGEKIIASDFIYELKSRAVNSNWDLTFFVTCLHLVSILAKINQINHDWANKLSREDITIEEKLQELGKLLKGQEYDSSISASVICQFWRETSGLKGNEVVEYVTVFTQKILGRNFLSLEAKGDLWQLCYQNFQDWYEGKKGYNLPDDETVLELEKIEATLRILKNSGYKLAIATGRPRNEVIQPLTALGLLQYFDSTRIITYDEVLKAESILSNSGSIKLGKPHPFIVLKAIHPEEPDEILLKQEFQRRERKYAAYIGDAASDVVAAKQAGCISIGVLTGLAGDKQKILTDAGCDLLLNSIIELPQWLGLKID